MLFLKSELIRLKDLTMSDNLDLKNHFDIQKWTHVYSDIQKAQSRLINYSIVIQVRKNEPTY